MKYVDGFVIPVLQKNLAAYFKMSKKAGKIWMEHGALEYRECAGDDLANSCGIPFPKLVKTKPGETVAFAWIVFKSKADRNRINAKVMKDPRIAAMCESKDMPFDCKRMTYGGFKVGVDF
ncbi:MAG: DUF1428 domain-containing protein [Planctomycetaceae bacterium]